MVELLTGVADAVAVAHAANILHRDIKPENILLTKSGYAKLADFGLAKLAKGSRPPTESTITIGTRPGTILGTPAYMSPEQASGAPLDARSDIFSFGVVLYEILSGERPFGGTSEVDLLHAIVHTPPPPLPANLPPALRTLVEKALKKTQRIVTRPCGTWWSICGESQGSRPDSGVTPATRRPRRLLLGGVVIAAGAAAIATWFVLSRAATSAPAMPVPLTALPGGSRQPSFPPDGNKVAFMWNGQSGGNWNIYVKQIGASSLLRLGQRSRARHLPRRSPDDRGIAFLRGAL